MALRRGAVRLLSLRQCVVAAGSATRGFAAQPARNEDEYEKFATDNSRSHVTWPKVLNAPLVDVDPELYDIIEKEKNRQYKVLLVHNSKSHSRLGTDFPGHPSGIDDGISSRPSW
eukprot:gene12161-12299_t